MIKLFGALSILGVILAGSSWLYLNPYAIEDWLALRDYQPTSEIAAISNRIGLSDKAEKIFYVHKPEILSADTFNETCPVERSIVLGCYDGSGIYVYRVEEERLDGIHEVTAAHEILHAVYDRLDSGDKEEINEWLNVALLKLDDSRIQDVVDSYRNKGDEVVLNELHSILATEAEDLPEFLEEYYKQYFEDRSRVVALSQDYEAVFQGLRDEVEKLDNELTDLSGKISLLEASLGSMSSSIAKERNRIQGLLDDNQIQAYNQAIASFNDSINSYNKDLSELEDLVADYNQIVKRRNTITVEQNQLVDSIDSRFRQEEI